MLMPGAAFVYTALQARVVELQQECMLRPDLSGEYALHVPYMQPRTFWDPVTNAVSRPERLVAPHLWGQERRGHVLRSGDSFAECTHFDGQKRMWAAAATETAHVPENCLAYAVRHAYHEELANFPDSVPRDGWGVLRAMLQVLQRADPDAIPAEEGPSYEMHYPLAIPTTGVVQAVGESHEAAWRRVVAQHAAEVAPLLGARFRRRLVNEVMEREFWPRTSAGQRQRWQWVDCAELRTEQRLGALTADRAFFENKPRLGGQVRTSVIGFLGHPGLTENSRHPRPPLPQP